MNLYEPQYTYTPPNELPDQLSAPTNVYMAPSQQAGNNPPTINYPPAAPVSDYIDLTTKIMSYKGMTLELTPEQVNDLKRIAAKYCIAKLKHDLEERNAE